MLDPTRIIGLIACLFALVSCGIAWAIVRGAAHRGRLAAALAVFEAALFLDMAFNVRWQLHDLLENEAIARSLYGQRFGPQHVALSLIGCALAAGMGLALWRLRGRAGASLAVCGGILSLSCWCVEVISLHAVDAVLYRTVHGVMFVSLIWIVCSLMTGVGILWDALAFRTHPPR